MALRMITTSKVVLMTFDVLFDVVIFVVVINSFRRCDNSLFDVLIALIILFDVVMVCMVFDVLIFVVLTFSLMQEVNMKHFFVNS
jgi:hypothetical protein